MNSIIRKKAIIARNALSSEQVLGYSTKICTSLIELIKKNPLQTNQFIAVYLKTKNEVDLSFFINWAFEKNLNLCAPVIRDKSEKTAGLMDFFVLEKTAKFNVNRFGIAEVENCQKKLIHPQEIAIAVFPLSGFDEAGHRLGMGGGYYDRYFSDLETSKIGVAFEVQKVEAGKIEKQSYDLKLDKLVSEKQIYIF